MGRGCGVGRGLGVALGVADHLMRERAFAPVRALELLGQDDAEVPLDRRGQPQLLDAQDRQEKPPPAMPNFLVTSVKVASPLL